MSNPLISIIIPVYKVEKEIDSCVRSVINQTYRNIEIILVDDGSPDNCGLICDEYSNLDSRIKVIHKENGGLSDARNYGLDISIGDYIIFIDSDDIVHSKFVEILCNNIGDADLCICDFQTFYDESILNIDDVGDYSVEIRNPKDLIINLFKYRYPLGVVSWNKLYKRKLWEELRYPVGKIHEDEFVIHHIFDTAIEVIIVNVNLYFYRQREGSIMHNESFNKIALIHKMEAFYDRKLFLINKNWNEGIKQLNSEILYRCLMRSIDKDNFVWKKMTLKDILFNNDLSLKARILLVIKKKNYKFYLFLLNKIKY